MSKKYKEELNKIVMNEEIKKRILNNVLNENRKTKRKKYPLKRIHIQIAAACFVAVVCFSAAKSFMQRNKSLQKQISQNAYDKNKDLPQEEAVPKDTSNEDSNESPVITEGNPIKEYKTIEEAEDTVKFKINTIKVLPGKFNIDNISVISEEIIQIEYNNGKDTINFRAGKSVDDISGDYSKYAFEKSLKLNDKYIKVKGHTDGKVNLALWHIGDISYSLSAPNGIEEERVSEMIKNSF